MSSKGRIMTYFGVPLPPWKHEKMGSGQCTIRFVLTGSIISKKNNQSIVLITKDAKDFLKKRAVDGIVTLEIALEAVKMVKAKLRGNKEYQTFLEKVRPVIEEQKAYWIDRLKDKGLTQFPIPRSAMSLRLYFKGQYIQDTVNKQQTVQDVLVDCGVIADDNYVNLNPIDSKSALYYEEIIENIAFVSLSFRLDDKRELRKRKK